jgi:hypothetical protein
MERSLTQKIAEFAAIRDEFNRHGTDYCLKHRRCLCGTKTINTA